MSESDKEVPKSKAGAIIAITLGVAIIIGMVSMAKSSENQTTYSAGSALPPLVNHSQDNNSTVKVLPKEEPTSAVSTNAAEQSKPKEQLYKINDKVQAGKFDYVVSEANITDTIMTSYKGYKTDNQYVVIKLTITNNDDKPRDIGTSLFQLQDANGKTYDAAKISSSSDGFLVYETLNPGLSRTRTIAFETPKGLKGLKLDCNSGVLLAGGNHYLVDLGL